MSDERAPLDDNPFTIGEYRDGRLISTGDVRRFSGVPTFLKAPLLAEVENPTVGIVGVPYDGGTIRTPGSRFGPRCAAGTRDYSDPVVKRRQISSLLAACAIPFVLASGAPLVTAQDAELDDSERGKPDGHEVPRARARRVSGIAGFARAEHRPGIEEGRAPQG